MQNVKSAIDKKLSRRDTFTFHFDISILLLQL